MICSTRSERGIRLLQENHIFWLLCLPVVCSTGMGSQPPLSTCSVMKKSTWACIFGACHMSCDTSAGTVIGPSWYLCLRSATPWFLLGSRWGTKTHNLGICVWSSPELLALVGLMVGPGIVLGAIATEVALWIHNLLLVWLTSLLMPDLLPFNTPQGHWLQCEVVPTPPVPLPRSVCHSGVKLAY